MRVLVNRSNIIAFSLLGILLLFPTSIMAEEDPEETGKMRVKLERIGQSDEEREKLGSTDNKETELDKMAPSLFEEQTRNALLSKQRELNESTEQLENSLFVAKSESNTTLKNAEAILFSSNYQVETTSPSNVNTNNIENSEDGPIGFHIVAGLFGFVLVGCAGIFLMMRKMFG